MRTKFTFQQNIESFWDKVEFTTYCWNWIGGCNSRGYGMFWDGKTTVPAYRFSYELNYGKVAKGLDLDHLCRNHNCVNPEHLEAVPHRVNVLRGIGITATNSRKTHCIHGHELSGGNLYIYDNQRKCNKCRRQAWRDWNARR